jgi:hypothetical protein
MQQDLNYEEQPIKMRGQIEIIIRDAKTGKIKSVDHIKNMVVTLAKEAMAGGLIQETGRGYITVCALGTGTNAPALGNTGLQTEIGRKLVSVRSRTNNQAIFETFFTTAEANGVLREAGLFGDNTADASIPGSGILFCRAAINRTKTSNDTLTLRWTVIIG